MDHNATSTMLLFLGIENHILETYYVLEALPHCRESVLKNLKNVKVKIPPAANLAVITWVADHFKLSMAGKSRVIMTTCEAGKLGIARRIYLASTFAGYPRTTIKRLGNLARTRGRWSLVGCIIEREIFRGKACSDVSLVLEWTKTHNLFMFGNTDNLVAEAKKISVPRLVAWISF